jgi:hypothetical protein
MGQASSAAACALRADHEHEEQEEEEGEGGGGGRVGGRFKGIDLIAFVRDECLVVVFQKLELANKRRCSLVSKKWHRVEGRGGGNSPCKLGLRLGWLCWHC